MIASVTVIVVLWALSVLFAFYLGQKRASGLIQRTFSRASREHHAKRERARALRKEPDVAAVEIPVDAPAWGTRFSHARRPDRAQKLQEIAERRGIYKLAKENS